MKDLRSFFTIKKITTATIFVAAAFGVSFSLSSSAPVSTFLGSVHESAPKHGAELSLSPAEKIVPREITFIINVALQPHDVIPREVRTKISFDPEKLEVVFVDLKTSDLVSAATDNTLLYDNTNGTITLPQQYVGTEKNPLRVATLYMRSLDAVGTTEMNIATGNEGSLVTARNSQGNTLENTSNSKISIVLQAP